MKGLFGKTKTMACTYCGTVREWPEHFVSRTYAECLTCWLRKNPEHIDPMCSALAEVDASANGGPT